MKQIFLIRHAKSSWEQPGLADHDRPLNERGKRDAPFMAQLLCSSGLRVDGMVSSTAKRARKTAREFARAYGHKKSFIQLEESLYHAYPVEITRLVRRLPEEWNTVLLFGHNPGFTDLSNLFLGDYIDNVPTCGVVGASSEVNSWADWKPERARRHLFYYPKQYFA